jgi:hypothetical protein
MRISLERIRTADSGGVPAPSRTWSSSPTDRDRPGWSRTWSASCRRAAYPRISRPAAAGSLLRPVGRQVPPGTGGHLGDPVSHRRCRDVSGARCPRRAHRHACAREGASRQGLRTRWTVTQPGGPEAVGFKGRIFWWCLWWLSLPLQVLILVFSLFDGAAGNEGGVARGLRRIRWRAGGQIPLEFRSSGDRLLLHAAGIGLAARGRVRDPQRPARPGTTRQQNPRRSLRPHRPTPPRPRRRIWHLASGTTGPPAPRSSDP